MIDYKAIATQLKIQVEQIKKIDEWVNVLFVVIKGKGARFVSKKVGIVQKQYLDEVQKLIDKANSCTGEAKVYNLITKDKAAKWAAEAIQKYGCGMDEELISLLWNNISEGHKPGYLKSFKKAVQDNLDEMAFWAEENAKRALDSEAIEESEELLSFDKEWEFQTKTGWQF